MFKFLDDLNTNKTILVCDNETHMLLQEHYNHKLIPFKIMDYNTFIDYYLGTLDEEVYISLVKNNIPYELSKILVSHFLPYYYLNITDKRLDDVKDIIFNHFKINKYIQNELKNKDVIFINPNISNDLVKTILNISTNIKVKEINNNNNPNLFIIKEQNIDTEVDKMFNILTTNMVNCNEDIYLYLTSNDYLPIVLSKINLFKLNYSSDITTSIMDLTVGKELVNYLNKYYDKRNDLYSLFTEAIDHIKSTYLINEDTLEQIYKVLGKYTKYDILDYKLLNEIIVDNLKKIKVVNEVVKTNLKLITKLPNSLTNKNIYILGANQNNFPTLSKDRDYFTDQIRLKYNLTTSVEKNKFNVDNLVNNLNSTNYAYISYNISNEKIISDVLTKLNTIDYIEDIKNNTSKEVDELLYSKALDKYYIYKELSNELTDLYSQETKSKYNSYDHSFKGNIKIKKDVTLSATSLRSYYECNYKYYLDKILKIPSLSDRYVSLIGDYFHLMLKKLFSKQMELNDLEAETFKFIEESSYLKYDNQTKYYYTKYSEYVKSAYEYINSIYHQGDIYKIEYEKELTSLINTVVDDANYSDKIRGIVDKYFIYKIGEAYKVLIVDYKTSDIKSDLTLLPYGLDVQLPFYFYLLSLDELHYELIGSFIQQVMPKDLYKMDKGKTTVDQYQKELLYNGYFVEENKNNVLTKKRTKTISLEETKEIIKQVDELLKKAFSDIHQGVFKINPKLAGSTINSCSYCTYSSICYKRVTDYIVIDKKGKEEDNNENE